MTCINAYSLIESICVGAPSYIPSSEPTMPEGGSAAAASSHAESRAGGSMVVGGRNSDFSRLQGDFPQNGQVALETEKISEDS